MPSSHLIRAAAVAICVVATTGPVVAAQTPPPTGVPEVVRACFVPVAGVLYVIKRPGLLQSCLSLGPLQHTEVSWSREGPKGDAGEPGPAGPAGANGAVGDKGPVGDPGSTGATGDKGELGDKGSAGNAGATGDKGASGDKGPDGAAGPVGEKGPVGERGPAGARGEVGDTGPIGERGADGEKGPPGDKGAEGDKGETGDKGLVGEKGPVGDKGAVGEKGPTGDKGQIGLQGPTGTLLPCDNGCVTTPMIANLAVTNAKLATIDAPNRIANSATSATSTNIINRIVARDQPGTFDMGNTNAGHLTLNALRLGPSSDITHAGSVIIRRRGSGAPESASIYAGPAAGRAGPNENTSVGSSSLQLTTQGGNTAAGLASLQEMGGGIGNTAIGFRAMQAGVANGGSNVAVGASAGRAMGVSGASFASRNIAIGAGTGNAVLGTSNNIHVANSGANESATIRIGNITNHSRAFVAGIANSLVADAPVQVNITTGQLGVLTSSARFKVDVRDIGDASSALARLRPVSYRYRPDLDATGTLQYGLIAEDVDRVAPDLVSRDSTARPYTVRYDMLVPLLVDDVQRRRERLSMLRQESAALLRRLEQLERTAQP